MFKTRRRLKMVKEKGFAIKLIFFFFLSSSYDIEGEKNYFGTHQLFLFAVKCADFTKIVEKANNKKKLMFLGFLCLWF